jgi:hypothetical protein
MPSPEQRFNSDEEPPKKEAEPDPYYLAARFSREQTAGRAYSQAQQTIFSQDCDLSVYRFQLSEVWHMAVLGEKPPPDLERRLRRILALGEPLTLTKEVLQILFERRSQSTKEGPWVERHYRPGQRL